MSQSAVTVGNFDGVHIGHQAIVRALLDAASERKLEPVAMTFDPHPAAVLGHPVPPLLMTPRQRMDAIAALGVARCIIQPFTHETARTSAEEFIRRILIDGLKMKVLCIGPNTHLGRNREGTSERLRELARSLGFELILVPPVEVDGRTISSTAIRRALEAGNVHEAARDLGRFFETSGVVVKGVGRGRGLGFPTANLGPVETMLPASGVYATRLRWKGKKLPGVTNVGVRPTFESQGALSVETHLLDFKGELLRASVVVEWVARLRPERKFESADDLRVQLARDCAKAKREL